MTTTTDDGGPAYTDVACSFCGRHNRVAHMVGLTDELRICSVCAAKVAAILDTDAGVVGPEVEWTTRWPLKRPDEPSPPSPPSRSGRRAPSR